MEGGLDPNVVSAIVTVGSLVGGSLLAFFAIRRAREAKKRLIEGEPVRKKQPVAAPEPGPEPEPQTEPEIGEQPEPEPEAEAEAEPEREQARQRPPVRAPAKVLVLPVPAPAPAAMPVEKPTPARVPAAKPTRRDAGALQAGLQKTKAGWVARLGQVFAGRKDLDPTLVDEIEKVLLTADIGVRTSQKLLVDIRSSLGNREVADPMAVWAFLRRRTAEILAVQAPPLDFGAAARPFVLLVIGVNGSGKTTTIGKLAAALKAQQKTVLLAAGDTFRAAAVAQLEVWGARVGVPVVRGKEGADPSSVVFEAIKRAKSENIDVVVADTAGRLHTKTNLMDELQKVRRVIGKAHDGAPHETWLIIDATSGQNAIAQAQMFTQAMQVSGIILTKLDGTAKGGVILGITAELGLPVRYIGVGERLEDLREFDAEEFACALLDEAPEPATSSAS